VRKDRPTKKSTRREFAAQLGTVAAGIALSETVSSRVAAAAVATSDLSIDITGMCGLVHDRARARTEVIFVDTSVLGSGMPKHTPILMANLRDVMNPPEDSKPTTVIAVPSSSGSGVEQMGLWDLTDQQLSIRRPGGDEAAGGLRLNRPEGADALPVGLPRDVDDPEQWRDLRYIVQMENVCGQGRIADAIASLTEVPPVVAGRLRLAEGVLEGAIPSQENYRGVVFKFAGTHGRPTFSQPLTDTVCWRPSTESAALGNYVTIDIVPLRGGTAREARTLLISQRGRPCRLSISNLPARNPSDAIAHHAMSDEEMSALHFGVYYKLLLNEPAEKPLPALSRPLHGRKGTGLIHTSFCPPARFSR
jgi:hypothetical protein